MKRLIIVGTKADSGKGGISTALTGYIEGLKAHNIDYEFVVSHDGARNTIVCWLMALIKITVLALKYRSHAVFWFHCGPWLSMARKFTLAVIPRVCGAKTLGHIHSPTFNQYINGGLVTRLFLRLVLFPYSKIVALTPWWKSLMTEKGIKKTMIVSPNPNNSFSCQIAKQYLASPRGIQSDLSNLASSCHETDKNKNKVPDVSGKTEQNGPLKQVVSNKTERTKDELLDGIDESSGHPRESGDLYPEQNQRINILSMARMVEGKGVETVIDESSRHPREGGDLYPEQNQRINILSMARMVEGKGVETVIGAFELLPEHFTLTIAGDGAQLEHYQSIANKSSANNRIKFTGWIDGEEKHRLFSEADLFCLPSTYDSFGMVFIEAMAYDLPVVAYGWGPIKDVVTSDVGECCQIVSANEVANKIKLVAEQKGKYSSCGPKKVLSCYTPEQVAKNIIEQL